MSKNKPRSQPIPDDWNGVDTKLMMFCIPASQKWEAAAHGALWTLGRGRTWDESTGDVLAVQDVYRQIIEDTIMACNLDDLTTELDRIATSLESLDDKTPELIDLDTLVGLVNGGIAPGNLEAIAPILEIMSAISGLLPSIKINPADFLIDAFDRLSFKGPVVANLITMNGLLGTIAVGTLGEGGLKVVELLNTTVGTFVTRMGQLADMTIRATWDIWPDYLQGIFKGFIGTGQGGDHPGIPDEDKTLRVVAYNSINVQCGTCGGGSSTCGCDAWGGQEPEPGPNPGEVPAGTSPSTWQKSQEYYDQYKCRAANWIAQAHVEYLANLGQPGSLTSLVNGGTILLYLPLGWTILVPALFAQNLNNYLKSQAGMDPNFADTIATFQASLAASVDTISSLLYAAGSPADAQTEIETWLNTNAPGGLDASFVGEHMEALVRNEVANVLFDDGHSIADITNFPAASSCDSPDYSWTFDTDQEGWLYNAEGVVAPDTSVGVTSPGVVIIDLQNLTPNGVAGRWYIPLGTFGITITSTMIIRVCYRFTKWCASSARLYASDDMANENYTLGPAIFNSNWVTQERSLPPEWVGRELTEVGLYASVGPACGSAGEVECEIDFVEIVA